MNNDVLFEICYKKISEAVTDFYTKSEHHVENKKIIADLSAMLVRIWSIITEIIIKEDNEHEDEFKNEFKNAAGFFLDRFEEELQNALGSQKEIMKRIKGTH